MLMTSRMTGTNAKMQIANLAVGLNGAPRMQRRKQLAYARLALLVRRACACMSEGTRFRASTDTGGVVLLRAASAHSWLYTGRIFPGSTGHADCGVRRNAGSGGTGGGGDAIVGLGGGDCVRGCAWRRGGGEMRRGRAEGRGADCAGAGTGAATTAAASLSSQRSVARALASTRSSERLALRVFCFCGALAGAPRERMEIAGDAGRRVRWRLGGEGSGVGWRSGDGARGGGGERERV